MDRADGICDKPPQVNQSLEDLLFSGLTAGECHDAVERVLGPHGQTGPLGQDETDHHD